MTTSSASDRTPRGRRHLLHAVPLLATFVVAGSSVLYGDRLPDRVASHWSGSVADGWMSPTVLILLNGALILVLGFGMLQAATTVAVGGMARGLAGAACGLSAFLAALHVVTLRASLDAADRAAVPFPGTGLAIALLVAAVVGGLAAAIAPRGPDASANALTPERLEVLPGEAVVWTGAATAPVKLMLLPAVMAAIGLVVMALDEPWAGVVLLVSGALAATVLRVRVTVGPAGMTVRSGPFGLLRAHVPLSAVTAVHAEHVEPMAYGGWGLRVVPGARAVVVRCGEGIRVERDGKADLVVTVDDARRGAGVLLAHRAAAQA